MGHTPSTPKVNTPASATDPRYSTSGILNAQLKEKNRQGLLSTFGGRTGRDMNINKFAEAKANMRDPSAIPMLETLGKLYSSAAAASQARGVGNNKTNSSYKARTNAEAYNQKVDTINNYLKSYGVDDSGLAKAGGVHNSDKRAFHSGNYGIKNRAEVNQSVSDVGTSGEVFNQVAENVKKQKQAAKK